MQEVWWEHRIQALVNVDLTPMAVLREEDEVASYYEDQAVRMIV